MRLTKAEKKCLSSARDLLTELDAQLGDLPSCPKKAAEVIDEALLYLDGQLVQAPAE